MMSTKARNPEAENIQIAVTYRRLKTQDVVEVERGGGEKLGNAS
jgi:hypothetical protein